MPLDRLLLDINNPRIRAGTDQPDCIERLLRKPKQLLALAKDIAANGLSTAPILVEPAKGKKFVVWDGNRRITALKLLNDPSLARSKALQAQFAGVAARAAVAIPERIDVLASSDHEVLLKEVLGRHAGAQDGAGQLNWDALLRTMFLLGHKAVPKEYRLSGLLLMWAEEHGIQVADDFPISTVHRFLNKPNLARLGFHEKNGAVEPSVEKDVAVRIVERIVQDFESERVRVENVFDAALQDRYITGLLKELGLAGVKNTGDANDTGGDGGVGAGARAGAGAGKANDGASDDGAAADGRQKPGGRRKPLLKADWDRKSIVRPRFKPDIPDAYWKADEVLKELRRTETQKSHLATAALFRVFIEFSTKAYMKRHRMQPANEMHKNALAVIVHMRQHGRLDTGETDAATRRFKEKSQSSVGMQYATLNDFIHSFKNMPDRESLHVLWTDIEPYLEASWDDSRRPH
ncbi:ParB/Srx family N-terminal domain-containing protein [Luteimonas terricola]|uniref:ParB/Srx family N-terminal domain-containing protein n=1 Tax=Luteimonas terricola TaxID=645597 RepID=UPI00227AD07F|nr:ParB/Srx family N-terminal domain-containing protein [Luteimonas terricola]